MCLKVLHDLAVQNVFHDLTANTCQGDRPVVGWTAKITSIEDTGHVGLSPVFRNYTLLQRGMESESQCQGYFVCEVFQKPRFRWPLWIQVKQLLLNAFSCYSKVLHFRVGITVHASEARMIFCCEDINELDV